MSPKEIKELRDALGWSQERLAKSVGVQKTAICHWEKGERNPSGPAVLMLKHLRELLLPQIGKNFPQAS